MTDRYYVHGDAADDLPGRYYCARCDAFEEPAHFEDADHQAINHRRYMLSRTVARRYAQQVPLRWHRPPNPPNLFADQPKAPPRPFTMYGRWTHDCCILGGTADATAGTILYNSFSEWRRATGLPVMNMYAFYAMLDPFHPRLKRLSVALPMLFKGIRLK